MLPLAPGANGQPPSPPTDASIEVTPMSIAASTLASPVPRVSWKCTPTSIRGQAARTASTRSTTRFGVVVPIVSPRHSWSAPCSTAARAISTTRSAGVRPSKGQSHAVATITSQRPPTACASAVISWIRDTASAVVRRTFARLWPSAADTTYSRSRMPAVVARSAPLTPAASAGTAFGETKLVTSTRRTPVATIASSIRSLPSSGIGASSCSPSRMPTSRRSTAAGRCILVVLPSQLSAPWSRIRDGYAPPVSETAHGNTHDGSTDDRAVRSRSFGQVADAYHRFRPRTPDELVRWLLPAAATTVVDLAAGTGALSEVLSPHVTRVIAVEPDGGMRAVLRHVAANVSPVGGTAEAIPLAADAVDAVLVSSAWHWFDAERASAEIARVVRPGGRLALVGNSFDPDVDWVMALRRPIAGERSRPSAARPEFPAVAPFTDVETTTVRWTWPM